MENPLFARFLARIAALEERRGAPELRRRLLEGLRGDVVEVGPGSGVSFPYYPAAVTALTAVEPETHLRGLATAAAADSSLDIDVIDGLADALPLPDASADAVVVSGVLCSVPDQGAALAEFARVLRPGGELRFFEHVAARAPRLRAVQRALDATVWPHAMGGCHLGRETQTSIKAAGFEITTLRRFSFRPTAFAAPVAPRILGAARRP